MNVNGKITFRTLRTDEIECRVAIINDKGITLLLYKDARVNMDLLDETVGTENWQRTHELINGNLFCNVSIQIADKWVTKQDVGVESYTEKEKGQASDSFKRACVNWGIGRELYTAPFVWVSADKVTWTDKNGKKTTYDKFYVKTIEYDNNSNISKLIIANAKTHKVVFSTNEEQKDVEEPQITPEQNRKILQLINELDITKLQIIKHLEKTGVDDILKLTKEQADIYITFLENKKVKKGVENAILENAKESSKNEKQTNSL